MIYLVIGIAILPIVVLCLYIYKKDVDKEPRHLLKRIFILGMFSVIPIVFSENIVQKLLSIENNNDLITLFASTFIGVALIEELAKWLVVYFGVYNNKEFNHPYDAIVYSVYSSLGFAIVENICYIISSPPTYVMRVGIYRAILTVPAHAFFGVIMGYFLSQAKKEEYSANITMSNRFMALSILMSVTAHAVYDYLLFTERDEFVTIFFIFVALLYVLCFRLINIVSNDNRNFDGSYVLSRDMEKIENTRIRKIISKKSFLYSMLVLFIFSFLLLISAIILSTLFLT